MEDKDFYDSNLGIFMSTFVVLLLFPLSSMILFLLALKERCLSRDRRLIKSLSQIARYISQP